MSQPVFDAHFHVIDPRFPVTANQGYAPEPFTVDDYRERTASLERRGMPVVGGVVVSGSFQGFDQTYLLDALERLGPGFVGVTQLPGDVDDAEIARLARAGVRGVRFNLYRGGSAGLDELDALARRVHEVAGWHVEVYVDGRELADLAPRLRALPAVVIDHLGMHADGLATLLDLVEHGATVKATGFGRVELDVAATVRAILAANPGALMVGTDLPSTRARRSFADADLELVAELAGEHAGTVLHDTAANVYAPRTS